MTRFITATLTLALFTGLSSSNVSAQDALSVLIDSEGGGSDLYLPDTVDGLIAIIAIAATEVGIIDPADCPRIMDAGLTGPIGGTLDRTPTIMDPATAGVGVHPWDRAGIIDPSDCPELGGQEGEDIMGLWFELVDAGYTEDEAFDLIEMVIGDHNALGFEGESVNTLTSYEGKLPIAEPLPERLPVKSY